MIRKAQSPVVADVGADIIQLTEKQVGRIIGKSGSCLRLWRKQGTGPPWRALGRSIRYPLIELRAWIGAHELNAPGADR